MQRFHAFGNTVLLALFALTVLTGVPNVAQAAPITVKVTIESLAPTNGNFLTPVWIAFHNGSFDIYNSGEAASPGLESLAEDGATAGLSAEFLASGAGTVDATLDGIGPIGPGQTVSAMFTLESTSTMNRYFSYASMVIPSNDAFVANGNPFAFPIFDGLGNFLGATFVILGSNVLDAGTEVNDEIASNTAFFGQAAPNTGVDQNGVVGAHPGFIPGGPILSSAQFSGANFLGSDYQIARVTIEEVPEPSTILLSLAGLGLVAFRLRKRATVAR